MQWHYNAHMIRNCNFCDKEYHAEMRYINRGQGLFCSQTCANRNRASNITPPKPNMTCAHCGVEFYMRPSRVKYSKSGLMFCSRAHKDAAQRLGGIEAIMPSHYGTAQIPEYRKKAFAHYPHECAHCGWNKYPDVLEVNHINIDRSDGSIENLEILCPTCHQVFHYTTQTGRYSPKR